MRIPITLDGPAVTSDKTMIAVACPTCEWWEISNAVRLECPVDSGHARTCAVHVRVECVADCWDDWFDRIPNGCLCGAKVRVTQMQLPT